MVSTLTSSVAFLQFSFHRKTEKNTDCMERLVKNPNHTPATQMKKGLLNEI